MKYVNVSRSFRYYQNDTKFGLRFSRMSVLEYIKRGQRVQGLMNPQVGHRLMMNLVRRKSTKTCICFNVRVLEGVKQSSLCNIIHH